MNIIEFQKRFAPYKVFSLRDICKVESDFSYRQLDRWEKKGYLRKVRRGFYVLDDQEMSEPFLFLVANKIYSPSYVSLEKALKHYGLIPEEVFQITSVSTKKTVNFETTIGNFAYRNVRPDLFWGYVLVEFDGQKVMLAEPEKAILDYLYLNPRLKTFEDFVEMRINFDSFCREVDVKKFELYLSYFGNKTLEKRAKIFLNTIQNH